MTASTYSVQSNALADKMSPIFVENVRAKLDYYGLKLSYWCDAVRHATDVHNRTVTPKLEGKTPV